MSKIYDWFEERLEIQAIADDITSVRFVLDERFRKEMVTEV